MLFVLGLTFLLGVSSGDESCDDGGAVGTGDRASGHNLQWTKVGLKIYINYMIRI